MFTDVRRRRLGVGLVLGTRVVELATESMVYREKAAACELLDAVVKLCIGRHAQRPGDYDWSGQYSHLFP